MQGAEFPTFLREAQAGTTIVSSGEDRATTVAPSKTIEKQEG